MVATESLSKAAINSIEEMLSGSDEDGEIVFKDNELQGVPIIIGLAISLHMSLKSLMVYGVYLNDLIAMISSDHQKTDSAIFKAVKIDPTVLACKSVATAD